MTKMIISRNVDVFHTQTGDIPKLLKAIDDRARKMGLLEHDTTDSETWDALENIDQCPTCQGTIKGLRSNNVVNGRTEFMIMCRKCSIVGSAFVDNGIIV